MPWAKGTGDGNEFLSSELASADKTDKSMSNLIILSSTPIHDDIVLIIIIYMVNEWQPRKR